MKFVKKVFRVNIVVLSCISTYAMGSIAPIQVPIIVDNGLVIFVPAPAPIIELKGLSTINLIVGKKYVELGASAVDNVDISKITTSGTVNIFKSGTYTITYTATDKSGNKTELTRTVIVNSIESLLPHDTNLYYAPYNEKGYLYFADPQELEHGHNRVIRVNYETMAFNESSDSIVLTEDAYLIDGKVQSNPHSVDRAGKTNKLYVRTQNAYSFDVVAVENEKLVYKKTVPLSVNVNGTNVAYSPRAFGAYNAKYNIQLLSARNSAGYNIVSIVDVKTDEVIKHLYKTIGATSSTVTGHAKWLNEDYFAMVDRGNHSIDVYKVFINDAGKVDAKYTSSIDTITPLHAIERVKNPKNSEDLNTFYLLGTSVDIDGGKIHPFVKRLTFDPKKGEFVIQKGCLRRPDIASFSSTNYTGLTQKNIPATTHHANITADGKYIIVPVYDGKIYKVDRETMQIVACVNTGVEKGLGAAHIEFSESLNLAIITNHWSPYITIIDTSNNQFILKGFVKIYRDGHHDIYNPDEKHLMQPHFAQMSKDGKYFYTFASQDNGRFVRVNLEEVIKHNINANGVFIFDNNDNNSSVLKSVDVEGAPEQAHS